MKTKKREEIEQEAKPTCGCGDLRRVWLDMNRDKMDLSRIEKTVTEDQRFDGLGIA